MFCSKICYFLQLRQQQNYFIALLFSGNRVIQKGRDFYKDFIGVIFIENPVVQMYKGEWFSRYRREHFLDLIKLIVVKDK